MWRSRIASRRLAGVRAFTTTNSNYSTRLVIQEKIREREFEIGSVSLNSNKKLLDGFGRVHDYLRISLTEKCNLRCTYCMPEQGVALMPKNDLLTTLEIERLAQIFVAEGVKKIRLTGGEPTVRRDLVDVVERLGKLKLDSLGMTSNGIALKRKLPALVAAGLTHLNLSLDTLDTHQYELITRRRGFETVMEALEIAQSFPTLTVKINCVVIKGLNDHEVPAFVELTRDRNITVRFIEYMPFEDNNWATAKLVPSATLLSHLSNIHPVITKLVDPQSDTTRSYAIPTFKGKFGFISSMSHHFCGSCSRLRIGPDGSVKVCLFGAPVLKLRDMLRDGTSEIEMIENVRGVLKGKKFAHDGLGSPEGIKENGKSGPMVGIGTMARANRYNSRYKRPQILPHLLGSTARSQIRYTSTSSTAPLAELTHLDSKTGLPSMVSVSAKAPTLRSATATGTIYLNQVAWDLITPVSGSTPELISKKGNVLLIAQLAGLMGSKLTSSLIPLCHPLPLTHVSVTLIPQTFNQSILIECTAECEGKTGVEMEALTGVTVAALTVWDMLKAVAGKEMRIGDIFVKEKSGGKGGDWSRT